MLISLLETMGTFMFKSMIWVQQMMVIQAKSCFEMIEASTTSNFTAESEMVMHPSNWNHDLEICGNAYFDAW